MRRASITIAAVILTAGTVSAVTHGKTIYVDADAAGANNGSAWADAYRFLQDALTDANSSDEPVEIRVAQGVYRPDRSTAEPNGTRDREATFKLISGVTLKGGYGGFGEPDPNARDMDRHKTILSGDLEGNDGDIGDVTDLLEHPSRGENSYHVVSASKTERTASVDGFTVRGGNANGSYYGEDIGGGGAIYCTSGTPTVDNCTFTNNSGRWQGAVVWCTELAAPRLRDCAFIGNYGLASSAVHISGKSCPVISDCTFVNNRGGAIEIDYTNWNANPIITGCMFSDNSAGLGGAVYIAADATFCECVFKGNLAHSGGAVLCSGCAHATFLESSFSNNSAAIGGGAFYNVGTGDGFPSLTLVACTFKGNVAYNGGAICNSDFTFADMNKCIFVANRAHYGGAIHNSVADDGVVAVWLNNCTFSGNHASITGGGIHNADPILPEYVSSALTNCILWDDTPDEIRATDGSFVDYCNVQGGWPGTGNIDADPCFVDIGHWDDNDTPEETWDDFYVSGDYHLKSQGGRWDANEGRWVIDDLTSPCIDAGDPMSPIGYEPFPNGGIINMGAYGGTAEASKSYFGKPPCATIVAGDVNGDCKVNFLDFRLMALHWLEER